MGSWIFILSSVSATVCTGVSILVFSLQSWKRNLGVYGFVLLCSVLCGFWGLGTQIFMLVWCFLHWPISSGPRAGVVFLLSQPGWKTSEFPGQVNSLPFPPWLGWASTLSLNLTLTWQPGSFLSFLPFALQFFCLYYPVLSQLALSMQTLSGGLS